MNIVVLMVNWISELHEISKYIILRCRHDPPSELWDAQDFTNESKMMSLFSKISCVSRSTPQPLYNTINWVQYNFHVSYPMCYNESKIYRYIGKHYENTPMQYTENCLVVKMKNFTGKF